MRRRLVWCLLSLVSFLVAGAVVRAALPWPWFDVTAKLRALEERGSDEPPIQVVFLGNSRVLHGVNPLAFDDRLAELGLPLRSFNLAGPGMGSWEIDHVLDRLLDAPPRGLRYVFLQIGRFAPTVTERELMTERAIYWHDVGGTVGAIRAAWIQPRYSRRDAWRLSRVHAGYFLRWMTSYGLAISRIRPPESRRIGADRRAFTERILAERGFTALDDEAEWLHERRDEFLEDQDDWLEELERRKDRARGRRRGRQNHPNPRPLQRQVAKIEAAGLTPIYFAEPRKARRGARARVAADEYLPIFLDLNDVRRYPTLFRLDRQYDNTHLNRLGAEEFSSALAEAFAGWLEESGRAQNWK